MTLILSTVCKNGICVCADKRNTRPNSTPQDNLYKIYSFKKIPLIIYNHGVNKFNNKMWDEYCSEYENLNKWIHYKMSGICGNFRKFIEKNVDQELKKNSQNNLSDKYKNSFFVFCGKTDNDTNLEIHELRWSYGSDGLQFKREHLEKLVRSGDGKNYLDDYLERNKNIDMNDYWENLDTIQAEEELRKLFLEAVKEKNRLGGNEFSDDFDTKCIVIK